MAQHRGPTEHRCVSPSCRQAHHRRMTTDIAQPSRHVLAARDRSLPGKISGRLKIALDLVVDQGLDPYEAAAKVGMHARSMRLALNKRHVLTYLRNAREVLRTTASAQNIHYAIKMRAESPNEMARLGAMKFIDNEEEHQRLSGSRQMSPGFVIVVQNAPAHMQQSAAPVTIDASRESEPVEAAEFVIAAPVEPEPEPSDTPIFRPLPPR